MALAAIHVKKPREAQIWNCCTGNPFLRILPDSNNRKCVIGMQLLFFGRWNIAGNVTENEGNRCARERAFNVEITPADSIKSF